MEVESDGVGGAPGVSETLAVGGAPAVGVTRDPQPFEHCNELKIYGT
jgi:hypothetical protein